ncbi:MAG TPA: DUF1573 domain-containing protein [Flavisolibacter sp.]|nr:DUF1573 domain-containing protein [Flavisolibacter sp.]
MKYLFIFLLSGTLVACANSDQKAAATNRDSLNQVALNDSASYTSIQWIDSTFQDLGKVNEGQVVDISWRLKNNGTKPLVIANVAPGCGCTVAEKPTEPIAPGEESVIRAKFDSKNQSEGEHRKSITVMANTKENPYYLSFKVDVTKK